MSLTVSSPVDATDSNGVIVSGFNIQLEYATSSEPGIVSALSQTFAGSKSLGANPSDQTTVGASSSVAVHQVNGGINYTTNTVSSSTYAVDSATTDYIIYTNSSSNPIAITLPVPSNGRALYVYDMAGTARANNITVLPNSSELIGGLFQQVLAVNYGGFSLVSDGVNWSVNVVPTSGSNLITSGSTYTTPVNITPQTQFEFVLVGGGGGGASCKQAAACASGGGGAGTCVLFVNGLSPNTAYNIAIGSDGLGGNLNVPVNPTNGGNTTLTIGATTYTANGGTGAVNGSGASEGFGGSSINGSVNIVGQDGGASQTGTTGAVAGAGGNSLWGLGGQCITKAQNGKNGTGYGAGGGGAHGIDGTLAWAGGNGTQGMILVRWSN